MTTTATPGRDALKWSCDERNRKQCRNGHGCHCREITDLLHRLAAKPADDGFPMSPSSLVAAWSRYVALFGEPPHGTEEQLRALLRLVPSGEPKQ